jgi:hypothetical protein
MGYCVARILRVLLLDAKWASTCFAYEVQSPPTHRHGVLHAATSPHAHLRSYMVGLRHISSNLLTTILSLVSRSTFRELGCLDPTGITPVRCLVIFVFSEKRIGGVCSCAHCLRARKILRQQLWHGLCCGAVLTPPLPPARVVHVWL